MDTGVRVPFPERSGHVGPTWVPRGVYCGLNSTIRGSHVGRAWPERWEAVDRPARALVGLSKYDGEL